LDQIEPFPESKEWGETVDPAKLALWLEANRIPLIAHPAAFRERWSKKDDGSMVGPFRPPPIERWKATGARVIQSEETYQLAPGCWTTGYIPRHGFEQSGRPHNRFYRKRDEFIPDDLEDDQAVVIHLKDKGLIVLSGCAHSGIVNTVEYAQQFTGIDRIYAVLGGFHLARASEDEIQKTIVYFKDLGVKYIVPSHCTGLLAISMFAQEMPDSFVEGVVGMRYIF
jgi:7,8-dihydropterin-6-yl-methyl-4-(beta-D-ribofuranosyl)aminobenzene 5'-phosphate synthase